MLALLAGYGQNNFPPDQLLLNPTAALGGHRVLSGWWAAQLLDSAIIRGIAVLDRVAILLHCIDTTSWTEPHAVGYAPDEGDLAPQAQNFSIFGPAGSMISTLDDARVWAEVLATGALLEPATQAERQEGAALQEGPPYGIYALGIGETDGWWGHNGEGLGFTAAVFHHPESGATVVVFMNASNVESGAHPADQMFRRTAEILATEAR